MPAPNIGTLPFDGPGLVDGTWLKGILAGQNPLPSAIQTYFGGGLGSFPEEGNISRQISAAGINPGATAADNVLAVYSIPANSFDAAGRGLIIQALGSFAANGNNKTVKIIFNPATAVVGSTVGGGGTTVATTGVSAGNGVGWQLGANIFKYGALGSNTQFTVQTAAIVGTALGGIGVPVNAAAVESAAILIAVTGNAATTATDIIFNFLEVNAMN